MFDPCSGLFLLALGMSVLAVIGHAIWLVVAATLRFLQSLAASQERAPVRNCPDCGQGLRPGILRCPSCSAWVGQQSPTRIVEELEATERQLQRLRLSGVLDSEQYNQLVRKVRREIAVLRSVMTEAGQPAAALPANPPQPVERPATRVPAAGEYLLELPPVAPKKPAPAVVSSIPPRPIPAAPPPQGRPLAEFLQAFMEDKNIRWGELLSGILIVGSAIGLVISLWATLRDAIPYFPALLFLLVTASIHGAGIYTLRRWKLKSTSRALLVIAALLIPLNFLAAIALSEQRPVTDPLYLTAVVTGLLAFGAMASVTGRVLFLQGGWLLVPAVLGASVGQLVIARHAAPGLSMRAISELAALPVGCYLATAVWQLVIAARWRRFTPRRIVNLFLLGGLALFSVLLALGLEVAKTGDLRGVLGELAPALSLVAIPALGLGLLIQRRLDQSPQFAAFRTAGTTLALSAAGVMLLVLALAWPRPELLIAVGLIDFFALTALALTARLAALHVPAMLALALAILVGCPLAQGTITGQEADLGRRLAAALLMGRSGLILMLVAWAAGGGALLFERIGRKAESRAYLTNLLVLAGLGSAIAFYSGFGSGVDRDLATLVFALATLATSLAGVKFRRPAVAWAASGLLGLTFLHGLAWNPAIAGWLEAAHLVPERPVLIAFLLHATAAAVVGLIILRRTPIADEPRGEVERPLGLAWAYSAHASSFLASPAVLIVNPQHFSAHAGYGFWLAGIWLCLSYGLRWKELFVGCQLMATIALSFAVTAICQLQPWWGGRYLDPRHLQAQFAALAVWSLLWVLVRRLTRGHAEAEKLWSGAETTIDRIALGISVIGIRLLAGFACAPGIAAELALNAAPSHFGREWLILLVLLIALGGIAATTVAAVRDRQIAWFLIFFSLVVGLSIPTWHQPVNAFWNVAAVDYHQASGVGAWLALALIGLALLASLSEGVTLPLFVGGLCLAQTVPLLIAALFDGEQAVASALRWSLGIFGLLAAAAVWSRDRLPSFARALPWRSQAHASINLVEIFRMLAVTLSAAPLLALTLRYLVATGEGYVLAGPLPESWFSRLPLAVSYGGPLILTALTLVGYALRERSPSFALAGSQMLNLAVSTTYLLTQAWVVTDATPREFIGFVQWNALALAGYTLLWLFVQRRFEPATEQNPALRLPPLRLQVILAAGLPLLLAALAASAVVVSPDRWHDAFSPLGAAASYLALVLSGAAGFWYCREQWPRLTPHLVAVFPAALACFAAADFGPQSSPQKWLALHLLTAGWTVVAACATALVWIVQEGYAEARPAVDGEKRTELHWPWDFVVPLERWAAVWGGLVVLLALRAIGSDPQRPWWSAGPTSVVALLAAAWALRNRSQSYAYVSTALAALAMTYAWITPWLGLGIAATNQSWVELIQADLIAIVWAGGSWLAAEVWYQRRSKSVFDPHSDIPPVSHAVSIFALAGGLWLAVTGLLWPGSAPFQIDVSNLGAAFLAFSLTALLICSLWDIKAAHALPGLYGCGILWLTLLLDQCELSDRQLLFGAALAAAGYLFLTGLIWTLRARWAAWGRELGILNLEALGTRTAKWLPRVNLIMAATVAVVEFSIVLTFEEFNLRMGGAAAAALLAPAMLMLAQDSRRPRFLDLTLLFATCAAVDFGWALLPVGADAHSWLAHSIRLLEVLAVAAFGYGAVLVQTLPVMSDWFQSARRVATLVGGAAIVTLLAVLTCEALAFDPIAGAPVTGAQTAVVAIVLVGLAAALVSLAVLPGRDPLELSETGRMLYVYAAEGVLLLLFVHIYLTLPELFRGLLTPYWPLIVMGIAFFGIGSGELFRRRGWKVLAEPLQRTGAFLPLLPALGFWVQSSRTDYSAVLFVVGLLYVVLTMWRRSFVYGVAAALAGNAGLWALWSEQGFAIALHPQLWLIPPALSALIAAQVNRERLQESQLTAIRYLAITLIYVSSTGEMFITGVADSLLMPMILAGLSILGALAGIVLRVRAFLYLGTSFLLLSIISMVWHAAQNIGHVWPWWVFGIAMGLIILTIFGMFEKKRQEVLQLLNELRQWE